MDNFDHLRNWMSLGEDELRSEYNAEAEKIVYELLEILVDESAQGINISADNFPQIVAELHELMVMGSKEFGKSLLLVEELVSDGKFNDALTELRDFIDWTPSKFYKDMAINQIKRIEKMEGN